MCHSFNLSYSSDMQHVRGHSFLCIATPRTECHVRTDLSLSPLTSVPSVHLLRRLMLNLEFSALNCQEVGIKFGKTMKGNPPKNYKENFQAYSFQWNDYVTFSPPLPPPPPPPVCVLSSFPLPFATSIQVSNRENFNLILEIQFFQRLAILWGMN